MEQVQVLFQFEEGGYAPIFIQSNSDVKMSEVIDKFKNKASDKNFKDYEFYFNDKIIIQDLKLSHFQLGERSSSSPIIIIVSVRKRSFLTKCPNCPANTCFLKIENFGLNYYGCPNKHKSTKTFDEYEDSQKINYSKIKCDNCHRTRKEVKELIKCLTCSKKFQRSCYYCSKCNAEFEEKNPKLKHEIIKYEDKNYICLDGCEYSFYCLNCEIDLCEICEKTHKNNKHNIIKYDSITPKIKSINRELEKIKAKIDESKIHIEQILKMIEDASQTLDNYYIICKDIVGKCETYNTKLKNYHVISNLNFLEKSNQVVMDNLNELLKGDNSKKDYLSKCDILFDIFYKERGNYTGSNTNDNNNPQKIEVRTQNDRNYINRNFKEESKNGKSYK